MGRKKASVVARIKNANKAASVHQQQALSKHAHLPVTATTSPSDDQSVPLSDMDQQLNVSHINATGVEEIMDRFVVLEELGLAPEIEDRVGDELELNESSMNESALDSFMLFLLKAQTEAVKRERDSKKRTRGSYTGNSIRTKQNHRLKRKQFVAAGGKLITDWFLASRPSTDSTTNPTSEPHLPDAEENEDLDTVEEIPRAHPVQTYDLLQDKLADPAEARARLDTILEEIKAVDKLVEVPTKSDAALNALRYKDRPALQKAAKALTDESKDRRIGLVLRTRITVMLGALNLYLDEYTSFTWRQSSFLAARSQGKGASHAQKI
ncbi:hypothetical protein F5878DRAFT_538386, partial [Lentinula raphanica]